MLTLVFKTKLTKKQTEQARSIFIRYRRENCALSCIPLIKEAIDAALADLAEMLIQDLIDNAQYSREFIIKTLAGENPNAQDGRLMQGKKVYG